MDLKHHAILEVFGYYETDDVVFLSMFVRPIDTDP